MKTKALYALSADPIHFGHLDIIKRASRDFDLTVLVASNPAKKYFFTIVERKSLVRHVVCQFVPDGENVNVMCAPPGRLTADIAFEQGISVIVRGIRNIGDYDMEKMMRDINISQQSGVETYFLSSDPQLSHISSTAAKEIFLHAGFVHQYVPLCVKFEMERKSGITIIGVTGGIGSGKSWFCEEIAKTRTDVFNLDMDAIVHHILFVSQTPAHREIRKKIRERFPLYCDGTMEEVLDDKERQWLAKLVFEDPANRIVLSSIMYQPILTEMRGKMCGRKGIVLLNAALLAEFDMTMICNHRVILITSPDSVRIDRLKRRGLTDEEINSRIGAQFTDVTKRARIQKKIDLDKYGKLFTFENDETKSLGGEDLYAILKEEFNPYLEL